IGGLSRSAALTLLRQRGIKGDDAVLGSLIENYGAHALTLDHLGGLIGQFQGSRSVGCSQSSKQTGQSQRLPVFGRVGQFPNFRCAIRIAVQLNGPDRRLLRSWFAHYSDLSEHPLMPYKESATALEQAFKDLGFGHKPSPALPAEMGPSDVWEG